MGIGVQNYKNIVFPLLSTLVLYLAFQLGFYSGLNTLILSVFSLDFLFQFLIGIFLFHFAKKEILVPLLQCLVMALFYLSTPIKMKFFASHPFSPYDIPALFSLLDMLPIIGRAAVYVIVAGGGMLFLYSLDFKKQHAGTVSVAGILLCVSIYSYAGEITSWLDKRYSQQVWNSEYNYRMQGGAVYFLHETIRMLGEKRVLPDALTAGSSLKALEEHDATPGSFSDVPREPKRNIHLIVVESFVDPLSIFSLSEEADPFYKLFRELYEVGGGSVSLSPVYTGGTANAEFEILCGLPVLYGKVAFEYEIKNESVPCLPMLLSSAGYHTVASHPNTENFWNRLHAYPRIGFQTYYHKENFDLDDMNGRLLSDESLFRQNIKHLKRLGKKDKPIFNYVLTISNHYPYELGFHRKSKKYTDDVYINNYMNMIHHSTREIYYHIQNLQQIDPESIIVVTGDHSPFFGPNLKGYVDSGFIKDKGYDETDLMRLTSTPLLIIDGQNGPVSVGKISHFEIPKLIFEYIGGEGLRVHDAVLSSGGYHMRPIPGYPLYMWNNHKSHICTEDENVPECELAKNWQKNVEVVRNDLLFGEQHLLSITN